MSRAKLHETTSTRFAEANGIRFAYRRFGNEEGLPLVFFQHFTGTMDNWDPILTNRLAEQRPVVLFDNAGIGRSTGTTPASVAEMARDAIAFMRTLGAPHVDLFGFSLGGMVAQQIAVDAPDFVRRIVLAGTGPEGGERMAEFSPKVTEIVTRANSTFEERCLALFFSPTDTSRAAGRVWLSRIAARKQDREPPASEAAASAQLQAFQAWGKGNGTRQAFLRRIHQPVLVVNGRDDIVVPTVNSFVLQQELPDARLILYPDSGHGAQFQYSDVFTEEVVRFLA